MKKPHTERLFLSLLSCLGTANWTIITNAHLCLWHEYFPHYLICCSLHLWESWGCLWPSLPFYKGNDRRLPKSSWKLCMATASPGPVCWGTLRCFIQTEHSSQWSLGRHEPCLPFLVSLSFIVPQDLFKATLSPSWSSLLDKLLTWSHLLRLKLRPLR